MLSYIGRFKSTKFVVLNSLPMVYCKKAFLAEVQNLFIHYRNELGTKGYTVQTKRRIYVVYIIHYYLVDETQIKLIVLRYHSVRHCFNAN